jgi:two-component system, chemotaxis family, chemotaxis protein CheY
MKRALIVDDSRAIRIVARRILERLGFDVSEAESAEHAIELWDHTPRDLMLANWYMKGAPWLIELARRNLRRHRTKLVVFLVENDPLEIGRALRAGADAFLLKPFNRETLEAKLDELGLSAGDTADVHESGSERVRVAVAAILESRPQYSDEADREQEPEEVPAGFGRRLMRDAVPADAGG